MIVNNDFLKAVPWLTTTLQTKAINGFEYPTTNLKETTIFLYPLDSHAVMGKPHQWMEATMAETNWTLGSGNGKGSS